MQENLTPQAQSKKISVIMASYLGNYPNRATNPEKKFLRAVKSFLTQSYQNKELVIVADGCLKTKELYEKNLTKFDNIKIVCIPKAPLYGGENRNAGLRVATGDIISYLDADDVIGKDHLSIIMSEFSDDVDLVYYDDFLVLSPDFKTLQRRIVELRYGSVGTSSISHRPLSTSWSDGYGHDYLFVSSLIINGAQFKKLSKPSEYLVTHWGNLSQPNHGDF
jgi:glycosyltransferase involved in cell wall biosynthesis